jgi:predicted TIM-barrel fold metal-dependent hydrolase
MTSHSSCTRRRFLIASAGATCGLAFSSPAADPAPGAAPAPEPVIDIHQHTNYAGRTNEQLIAHQRAMGVTTSVLLPAGRFYGLDAKCGDNDSVEALAQSHPREFVRFANEGADLEDAPEVVRRYLRRGAIGVGEQKFRVASDGHWLDRLCRVAEEFRVPVLLHFQHAVYNLGIENFHRTLERYPKVNFIGHAQTWWANVDAKAEQKVLYPTGPVTPGGITDRLLRDYPNMYGDMSAGSGLNHLVRDPEHAAAFLQRHQDKLLFGSDCDDLLGRGPGCQGAQILLNIRKLAPSRAIERKIVFENGRKMFRM